MSLHKHKKEYTVEKIHQSGLDTNKNNLVIEKFVVGDKNKNNYEGQFKIYVYHSDGLIRRASTKGYLFEQRVVIALWNVTKPKDDSVFLDIGSNVGTVVVPMAKHIKTCYAFEPQKPIRKLLRKNIKKNGVKDNVTVMKCAVGHYNGSANLDFRIVDHVGIVQELEYSGSKKINYGGVRIGIGGPKIKIITIDSMNLTNLTAMKVDVEGSEPLVFYGARKTIKKYRPFIAFEKNYQKLETDSMEALKLTQDILDFDIVKYVESIGYKCILEIMLDNFMLCPTDIPTTSDPNFKIYPTTSFTNNVFQSTKLKMFKLQKPKW
jgi:FkbM family methyltransferase